MEFFSRKYLFRNEAMVPKMPLESPLFSFLCWRQFWEFNSSLNVPQKGLFKTHLINLKAFYGVRVCSVLMCGLFRFHDGAVIFFRFVHLAKNAAKRKLRSARFWKKILSALTWMGSYIKQDISTSTLLWPYHSHRIQFYSYFDSFGIVRRFALDECTDKSAQNLFFVSNIASWT